MSVYYENDVSPISVEHYLAPSQNKLEQAINPFDKIVIKSKEGFKILSFEQIISIRSLPGNYAFFYTKAKKQHLCTKPLNYFEKNLPKSVFYRIHRSYIINLNHLISFDNKKSEVMMVDKTKLSVAARRKSAFKKLIHSNYS